MPNTKTGSDNDQNRQRSTGLTGTSKILEEQYIDKEIATQVPMIQKMQKTVEILQVQFIDKVVEISENMQSKDKRQRSRRNGISRKFTDSFVDDPIVLKRQWQPSAQVLDRIPTTGAKDATMQKDPNFSPQLSQTPSAKTRLTVSRHERQPTKRCQKCLKHEREREL